MEKDNVCYWFDLGEDGEKFVPYCNLDNKNVENCEGCEHYCDEATVEKLMRRLVELYDSGMEFEIVTK